MKAFAALAFSAAALLLGVRPAAAQVRVAKLNVLSPLVRTGSFAYEQQLGAHGSWQLGASLTSFSPDATTHLRGFALTPEYRRYLAADGAALRGFYVAPFVRYQKMRIDMQTTDEAYPDQRPYNLRVDVHTMSGGFVVGHQWLYGGRVTVDAFVGPSYSSHLASISLDDARIQDLPGPGTYTNFGVRAGLTVGLAF